jgi:hypothetical protein
LRPNISGDPGEITPSKKVHDAPTVHFAKAQCTLPLSQPPLKIARHMQNGYDLDPVVEHQVEHRMPSGVHPAQAEAG